MRVLAADDQPDVLEALRLLLKREQMAMVQATSPGGVLAALQAEDFDAALIDLNYARDTTSGKEGLDLLAQIRAIDPMLPIVVMSAWGTVEGAVEAMRRGARDYVQKPWDNARLLTTLRTQIELGRALRRSRRLEEENSRLRGNLPPLVAHAPVMQPVLRLLERVGPSEANVLITGEHGTGKEVVARWLHQSSKRAGKAMVVVNAGGLSEGVFESELFGHVRGAFTDAKTDRTGAFELRERGEDIPHLAQHFLAQQAAKYGKALKGFQPDALEALLRHPWTGNVRELEHAVERSVLMARGDRIAADDLFLSPAARRDSGQLYESMTLDEAERHLIQRALSRCAGNVSEAARELGVSRSALYRRLQHHGLKAQG